MANALSKWFHRQLKSTFRVVSVNAVNTVMAQSDTSLTKLKATAKKNANVMAIKSSNLKTQASKMITEAVLLDSDSTEIKNALKELDTAEGKL
jgi:hypothetical protein